MASDLDTANILHVTVQSDHKVKFTGLLEDKEMIALWDMGMHL